MVPSSSTQLEQVIVNVVLRETPMSGVTEHVPPCGSLLTRTTIEDWPVAMPFAGVVDVIVNSNFQRNMVGLSVNRELVASSSCVFWPITQR